MARRARKASTMKTFSEAVLPYRSEVFANAMRLLRNREAAEDATQDTLMRAFTAWDTAGVPDDAIGAWLYTILKNAFINAYNKRRRHHAIACDKALDYNNAFYPQAASFGTTRSPGGANVAGHQLHVTPPAIAASELCDEVKAALSRLRPEERAVVELADLKGMPYAQVARTLKVKPMTVGTRLLRARRALKAELAGFARSEYGIDRN